MRPLTQTLVVSLSFVLLLSAAAFHGSRTDRWGQDGSLDEAGRPLERIPETIGDWISAPVTLDEKQLQIGEIAGYLARDYVHQPTGNRLTLLIVYGRVGGVGAHPPNVCYQGAGYRIADKPEPFTLEGASGPNAFLSMRAVKDFPHPQALSIWWAWSANLKNWETPGYPRLRYALSPVLYKMYLIRSVDPSSTPETDTSLQAATTLSTEILRSLQ